MSPFISEMIGTALLILLGNGVVANVVLNKTKGNNSGWIVITFGWAIAVFVAVYVSAKASGAHLNPAVTIALAMSGKFAWSHVMKYILAQLLGAMIGSTIVWLSYRDHFNSTTDADGKLAVFCTGPAIRNTINNLITEAVGTFVLVFGVMCLAAPQVGIGSIDALPVSLIVLGIGLSLGGATGYAINPARDLGPRIIHALLPIKGKRDSDWSYSWIPVFGPIAGAALAVLIYSSIN